MRDERDEGFVFVANKDIAAGEEVFISYGPKGNSPLWVTYGFMLDENPHTCISAHTDVEAGMKVLYSSK
jgi:SET domain-containing protein